MRARSRLIAAAFEYGMGATYVVLAIVLQWWLVFIAGFFIAVGTSYLIGALHASRRKDRHGDDSGPGSHPILGARAEGDARSDEGARSRIVDEPVKGWKTARVHRNPDGSLMFEGYGMPYGVTSVATCAAGKSHAAPAENCTCGFYAYNEERLTPDGDLALLEVELYGKVIRYEQGYRAEKQRVLSVTVNPTCTAYVDRQFVGGSRYDYSCHQRASFHNANGPRCARHAIEEGIRFHEWVAEPVNCETEWRWAQ